MPALETLDAKHHRQAQELASQFLNYEIPFVTIENRSRDDVGTIFERINSTGTKLSALDLMTAWTWTDNFHLLDSCNALLQDLEDVSADVKMHQNCRFENVGQKRGVGPESGNDTPV